MKLSFKYLLEFGKILLGKYVGNGNRFLIFMEFRIKQ